MDTELEVLRRRIDYVEGILQGIVAKIGPRREDDGRTHLARVIDVFRNRPGMWLTAAEVAQQAGIDHGSARMVLYSNKETFTTVRISAGRVRWQLNPLQRFQEIIAPEPVMAAALEA